jgi:ankyrin repeat protein
LGQIAAKNFWGQTALHLAAREGHGDVVALLEKWEREHRDGGNANEEDQH